MASNEEFLNTVHGEDEEALDSRISEGNVEHQSEIKMPSDQQAHDPGVVNRIVDSVKGLLADADGEDIQ